MNIEPRSNIIERVELSDDVSKPMSLPHNGLRRRISCPRIIASRPHGPKCHAIKKFQRTQVQSRPLLPRASILELRSLSRRPSSPGPRSWATMIREPRSMLLGTTAAMKFAFRFDASKINATMFSAAFLIGSRKI